MSSSSLKATDCRRNSVLGLKRGAWTREEDLLLIDCVEKYGEGNWQKVPLRAGLSRCRKSCRLRWLNYLKPGIKRGEFDEYEIDLILRLHRLLGNRWALIAGRIPGRTANDIKNYWNSHLSRRFDPKTYMLTGKSRKRNGGNLKMGGEKRKKIRRSAVKKRKGIDEEKEEEEEENGAASTVLQANGGDGIRVKPQPLTLRANFHMGKAVRSPRRGNSSETSSSCEKVAKSGSMITIDPDPSNGSSSFNNASSEASIEKEVGNLAHPNSSDEDSWLMNALLSCDYDSSDRGDIAFPLSPTLIMNNNDDDVQVVTNRMLGLEDLDLDHDALWKSIPTWDT